jgi:iron(III) transport system permease protein
MSAYPAQKPRYTGSSRLAPLWLPFLATVIAVVIAAPVLSVFSNVFIGGTSETWHHLALTVLPEFIQNSLLLCVGVGLGVAITGTTTAFVVTMYEFPGRRIFEWALLLPLAMPAYVMAYVYTDLLQFVGPVQTGLRQLFGWKAGDYWFFDIRTAAGAIFVFVLFPYVYMLARTAFLERAGAMLEAGRSLGLGPWQSFFRVSIPLARPAIVAGTALALMETLADFGTVAYFGVQTFTTGIYRAWFSFGDRVAAAQLSAALLSFVVLVLLLERLSRGRARFHNTSRGTALPVRQRLSGFRAQAAIMLCFMPLFMGFLLPGVLLFEMALSEGDAQFGPRFLRLAGNSFTLAAITALFAVFLAVLLAYTARLSKGGLPPLLNRLVSLGYAVPGSVIAVGVLIPLTRLDHQLGALWQNLTGQHPGLLLTGGIAALIYAYLSRFLTVALHTVESSLMKITPNMDDAARSMGFGRLQTLWQVHVPILRPSLLTAGLLVFVDVMKELPATLVIRPFNFDTLATQTFTLAADERLAEASTAALMIVAVGLLPMLIISRQIVAKRRKVGITPQEP